MDRMLAAWVRQRARLGKLRRLVPALVQRAPEALHAWLAGALADEASGGANQASNVYERLYEEHGARLPREVSIGDGDFDLIGRIELELLIQEGLAPSHTVVDFGCGTGRLAVHLVPFLDGGRYVGIDIARSMLDRARALVSERFPAPRCRVEWLRQSAPQFPLPEASVDILCAFSVFTHMEHEDSYRYLVAARRIVRPGGRLVFSCLPMSLPVARDIFAHSAAMDVADRWKSVRNVTTSIDLMEELARMAGWEVLRWYPGDQPNVTVPDRGAFALGQSSCVLGRP